MSDPPLAVTVADLAIKFAGAVGALAAFTWGVGHGLRQWRQTLLQWDKGLEQWREGQKWKRAETFDKFVEQFESNELLQLGCKIVDWTAREVTFAGRPVVISNADVLMALRDHRDGVDRFAGEQPLIRDALDGLLTFFARLKMALDTGLIDVEPARVYFAYWLDRLITMKAHQVRSADADKKELFDALNGRSPSEMAAAYVAAYGDMRLIQALCEQFEVPLSQPRASALK